MFKRIVSFILIFVMISILLCSTAYAAVFSDTSKIIPMVETANYKVYLSLNISKPYDANLVYVAVYNKNGRLIDIQYAAAEPRMNDFFIAPKEYPVTVKAFVWSSSKIAIPFGETYVFELKSANQIISEQLADFIVLLKQKFPEEESFMYKLTTILDSIDEDIIEDAKNEELLIDRKLLQEKYPDAYAQVREIASELKSEEGGVNDAITDLSLIMNGNEEYKQLVVTLFTLLGVYDYI